MRRAAFAFLVLASCSHKATPAECDAMLDRYLDFTEEEQRPALRTEAIARRRASLAYLEAEKRCVREVSGGEMKCAMKAPSANDWEACIDY